MDLQLTIPSKLEPGDKVMLISPSSGLAGLVPHRVKRAVEALNNLGLEAVIAPNALVTGDYTAGTIAERVADIHLAFSDKSVKGVIAMIGGNHSAQLLKYIDWKLVKNNPKIFMGYSDLTVLHYALMTQAGLATYYSVCALTQLAEFPSMHEFTLYYLKNQVCTHPSDNFSLKPAEFYTDEVLNWFTKADTKRPRNTNPSNWRWLKEGSSSGLILGGSLISLFHLIGTKYWINPQNAIFFLDIPPGNGLGNSLPIDMIDALLTDLDNMNLFDQISGLIFSKAPHGNLEYEEKVIELIKKFTHSKDYPVVYGVELGHTDPLATIRLGQRVKVDSKLNAILFS
jgi:muramoyltetrapeptide carboxypeptidase